MFETVDDQSGSVLEGLDEMVAGAELGASLAEFDVSELSGYDLILLLKACKRMASHYEARSFEVMGALSEYMAELDDDPGFGPLASAAEIRAALRLTRRAADDALGMALTLAERLPRVGKALASGDIDLSRVRVIVRGTDHLSEETAREVVEQVIDDAGRLTTGQLAARIRRLCVEVDPDEAEQRHEAAVSARRMVAEPTPEGTAHLLGLDLPPGRVASAPAG